MRRLILAALVCVLPLGGCLASKIVTVPAGLAGDALEATGKGALYVGGQAVRVTGDALDGPDERVRLEVTYRKGRTTRTETREIKAKHLEREISKISGKGQVIDVEVSPIP
ncbi:MAG: hypothetical protein ACK4HR_04935 [Hyphomonas sp.]|jgi:hypothetical protein